MGNSESKDEEHVESRIVGGAVGGSASVAFAGGGIALMVLGGPVGMVVGGVLLGTGISSATSTVQQCASEKEFSYTHLGVSAGVGALGGVIGAPFSVAGGAAASALTTTGAKVATMVGAEVVGGAVSGGVSNTVSKAAAGEKPSWEDFGKGALIGGLAGGVGSAAGQATNALTQGAKTVGKLASKAATAGKITVGTVGGAAGGSGVAALSTLVENILSKGELKKSSFLDFMKELQADEYSAQRFWDILIQHEIIINAVIKKQIPKSLKLPDDLECYRVPVEQLIEKCLNRDITEGVGSAAIQGAITGGISGAVSTAVQIKDQRKAVKSQIRERADKVKKGAIGGSMEIETFARENKQRVVIHHDDGKTTSYGSKSASRETHLRYSSENQHYSPADLQGKRIPTKSSSTNSDCLFQALAHHSGDDPGHLRQKLATKMQEKPLKLKKLTLDEVSQGGLYHGGGFNVKKNITKNRKAALKALDCPNPKVKINDNIRQYLKDEAVLAINELNGLTRKSINDMIANPQSQNRGRHHIHYLHRDPQYQGKFAIDIYAGANPPTRGPHRLIFECVKVGETHKFEFIEWSYHYTPMCTSKATPIEKLATLIVVLMNHDNIDCYRLLSIVN